MMKQYRNAAGEKRNARGKSIMSVAVMKRAKREGMKVDGEMERTIKTGLERWRLEKKVVCRRGLRSSYLPSYDLPFLEYSD